MTEWEEMTEGFVGKELHTFWIHFWVGEQCNIRVVNAPNRDLALMAATAFICKPDNGLEYDNVGAMWYQSKDPKDEGKAYPTIGSVFASNGPLDDASEVQGYAWFRTDPDDLDQQLQEIDYLTGSLTGRTVKDLYDELTEEARGYVDPLFTPNQQWPPPWISKEGESPNGHLYIELTPCQRVSK